MKNYTNYAIIYAIIGLAMGVFYREFPKLVGFYGETRLSLLHGHYLSLGVFFFVLLLLLDKQFCFSGRLRVKQLVFAYTMGLNVTGLALFFRGILAVNGRELHPGLNASVSGIAGIGHILLGVSMVLLLFQVKKSITELET